MIASKEVRSNKMKKVAFNLNMDTKNFFVIVVLLFNVLEIIVMGCPSWDSTMSLDQTLICNLHT